MNQMLFRELHHSFYIGKSLVERESEEVGDSLPYQSSKLLIDLVLLPRISGIIMSQIFVYGLDDEVRLPLKFLPSLFIIVHIHEVVYDKHVIEGLTVQEILPLWDQK